MSGKLIVLEGLDYSFKETNSKELYKYIYKNITKKVVLLSFPNYTSKSSYFVKEYLAGNYGKVKDIDPHITTMFYALDRYDTIKKERVKELLDVGYYVIMDRYIGSNLQFASAYYKSKKDKDRFIKWTMEEEYGYLQLPREDITIYLNMPVDKSYPLIQKRKGYDKDMHESNKAYLKLVEENSNYIKNLLSWKNVDCLTPRGNIKTKGSIFNDIIKVLKQNNII